MGLDFSIIIPAKNEAANIGRCLDSIREIDWDKNRFEIIVVDNGSTDQTVAIAREKGALVFIKPELTISGLRNFGAAQSTGQILAFLDADCAVDKNWFKAASIYLNNTDGVAAFGSPVVVPENGTWVQNTWFLVRGKADQVQSVNWLESANLFVKQEAFTAIGGFSELLVTCEDYDLTQRLKNVGKLISDYRVRAIHYREPSTVSEFIKKEMWRGKSNYTNLLKRSIDLSEIPSLVLPIVYGLFLVAFIIGSVYSIINFPDIPWFIILLVIIWQFPLVAVSFKKGIRLGTISAIRLYLLFNAYFFARSLSLIRSKN